MYMMYNLDTSELKTQAIQFCSYYATAVIIYATAVSISTLHQRVFKFYSYWCTPHMAYPAYLVQTGKGHILASFSLQ